MVAAPYRAYILPARSCRPGKRSAARQQAQEMNGTIRQSPAMNIQRRSRFSARWRLRLTGNGHPAPLPLQCPVAAAPYRAYILPAR
ncbi:hypothetical protein NUBL17182_25330 [Klebsiella pneumoniae]|nr:hypothetical protein NUBL17182_25330 [Klebsiella pneumoniae]